MSRINLTRTEVEEIVDERLDERLAEQNSETSHSVDPDDPEQWPYEVMDGHDIGKAAEEQLAPAEYSIRQYGVDPEEYDSLESFRAAVDDVKEGSA